VQRKAMKDSATVSAAAATGMSTFKGSGAVSM
jgi:hypothetical protein